MATSEDGPSIVVLIPTLQNADELAIVLDALSIQSWKGPLKVIAVGPRGDSAQRIVEQRGMRWIDDEGSRNRADACNVALRHISCDIVLLTDDDVVPPPDWITKMVRWFDRPAVAGVGGPNFAPDGSSWAARVIDVTFCSRWVTAGTRYGKVPTGELVEISHNPGCNTAYRKSVLDEVGGFENGCIGAEDVVLDHRIRNAGHKLWFDPQSVMPHRRRVAGAFRRQMTNYGYVRTLANSRFPQLRSWSHVAIGFFPPLVLLVLASLMAAAVAEAMGAFILPWALLPVGIVGTYLLMCWAGAAFSASPHRSFSTVLFAPIGIFGAHLHYGHGVLKGLLQIYLGEGAAAGLGLQLDDKQRAD